MHVSNDVLHSRGENDDDIDVEELRGKRVCHSHICILTAGRRKDGRNVRPTYMKGIASLTNMDERQTVLWVRQTIFSPGVHLSGNVLFCNDLYRHYAGLCRRSALAENTGKVEG